MHHSLTDLILRHISWYLSKLSSLAENSGSYSTVFNHWYVAIFLDHPDTIRLLLFFIGLFSKCVNGHFVFWDLIFSIGRPCVFERSLSMRSLRSLLFNATHMEYYGWVFGHVHVSFPFLFSCNWVCLIMWSKISQNYTNDQSRIKHCFIACGILLA